MQKRNSDYPINQVLLNRQSSRGLKDSPIDDEDLFPLFEAARWAPSSYNNQPWRFIYAKKDSSYFEDFFDLLVEGNKQWCKNAAVLVVLISKTTFDKNGKPAKTHSFDTGAAFENLAIEGTSRGLLVHAMQGFDYEKAKSELNIPDEYQVEAMIAIGLIDKDLEKQEIPTNRKPLKDLLFEGKFK